jgi:NhaP-type Na+/H+ or K+/H+ antiporter
MLAPTDAALGKGVVTNKAVPGRIREGLNVESGLNDGISVPVLLVFLALATGTGGDNSSSVLALELVAREIGVGVGVGVVMALVGVKVISICAKRGWFADVWKQIPVVSLALACFATAQTLEGSGYIAAFVGGLLFGHFAKENTHKLVMAGEGISELLSLLTWVLFGGMVGKYLPGITLDVVIYSLLSLTLIRMLPAIIALAGLGEKLETKLFLAWFGPRGLATIVFCIIVANENLPSESVLIRAVVCTVTLCVFAHGLTANLWAKGIARRLKPE